MPFSPKDYQMALLTVQRYTGLDRLFETTQPDAKTVGLATRQVTMNGDQTPFLSREIDGRPAWCVEFRGVALELASSPGRADPYSRNFRVYLGLEDRRFLKATSAPSRQRDGSPRLSRSVAEAQMLDAGEVYCGFPPAAPAVSLLDALDAIPQTGLGDPLAAREIQALYVLYAREFTGPLPVWSITLRGASPRDPTLDIQIRNIVDAQSGRVILATNLPCVPEDA